MTKTVTIKDKEPSMKDIRAAVDTLTMFGSPPKHLLQKQDTIKVTKVSSTSGYIECCLNLDHNPTMETVAVQAAWVKKTQEERLAKLGSARKYELCKDDVIEKQGHTLYRIRAVRDFGNVKKDELGGYIESGLNLHHKLNCWVGGDATVFGDSEIFMNAQVYGNASVYGNSILCDDCKIHGNATVAGYSHIGGYAEICGDACMRDCKIYGIAEARRRKVIVGV